MRKLIPLMVVAGLFLASAATVLAATEKKTVEGKATCAKCALKETKTCQDVVTVKDGDKEVNYYLKKNKVADDNHKSGGFCDSSKKVKVTGEVTEKDGKKIIDATEIKVVED